MHSERRIFLRRALLGIAGFGLAGSLPMHLYGSSWKRASTSPSVPRFPRFPDDSPIAPVDGFNLGSLGFSGDNPTRAHAALWDKPAYLRSKGGIPAPFETAPVVIVGGGMSGLHSAYQLRGLRPLLLEQAPRLGGNSKGESLDGGLYSIGAAYFGKPAPGEPLAVLLGELGLLDRLRFDEPELQTMLYGQTAVAPLWRGATDPAHAEEFQRVWAFLRQIRAKSYPDVPWEEGGHLSLDQVQAMDRLSFGQWIDSEVQTRHPHILEFFREYCTSSLAGALDEVSAAQAINFLCSDLDGVAVLPGGNAAVAEALRARCVAASGAASLRAGCFVLDVSPTADGVVACYEQPDGTLRSVLAKACIVTSPKFVAARLVSGLPARQQEAIHRLRYRAFVVANVVLKTRIQAPGFDLFRLSSGQPQKLAHGGRGSYTDLVFAQWAEPRETSRSVLTLYRPYAYDGGRSELYAPDSFARTRSEFEQDLPDLLAAFGLGMDQLDALRLTRWGHALPLAERGLFASGALDTASASLGDRIHFAQQDNWANPSLETALSASRKACATVRKTLTGA